MQKELETPPELILVIIAGIFYCIWVAVWLYRERRIKRIEKSGHSVSRAREYQRNKLFSHGK